MTQSPAQAASMSIHARTRSYSRLKHAFIALTVALTAMLVSSSARAATSTWATTGGSGTDWNTAANWGGTLPASGNALSFALAGSNGASLTNSLTSGSFNVAGITFTSAATTAYTFAGNTFNLTAGITNSSVTASETFNNTELTNSVASTFTVTTNAGITLTNGLIDTSNANQTTTVSGAGGTLSLGGFTLNSGAATVTDTFAGSGNVTISGAVVNGGAGANGLTYNGTGTLTLSAANTYTGATNVGIFGTLATGANGGVMVLSGSGSIADTSSVTISGNGSKLLLDDSGGNVDRIPDTDTVTTSLGGELSLNGNATSNTTETIGTLAFDQGASIVTVTNGTAARTTTLAAGAFTRTNEGTGLFRGTNLGINQGSSPNFGSVTLTSTSGLTFVGANTIGAAASSSDATQSLKIVPYLVGDTSATGTGINFVTYDATNGLRVLSSAEDTTLVAGSTTATNPVNAVAFSGTLTGAPLTVNSLLFNASGTLTSSSSNALTINSGALLVTNGTTATIGSGFSGLTLGNGSWNEGDISVEGTGALTISTPITVTGSGGLVKTGTGTLTITPAIISNVGTVTINQGTLALGTLATNATLANNFAADGGTLSYTPVAGTTTFNGNLTGPTMSVTQSLSTGTTVLGGNDSYNGTTTASAGVLNLTGTLTDNGATTISGATYNVSGTLTENAATTLSGGAINLSGSMGGTSTITISNAAALSESSAGSLGGSVSIILSGPGASATLSGSNSFTGATTLGLASSSSSSFNTVDNAVGTQINLGNQYALSGGGALNLYYGTFDNSSTGGSAYTTLASTGTVNFESNSFVTFGGSRNLSFGSNVVTLATNATSNITLNNLGNISGGSVLTMGAATNAGANNVILNVNGAGNTLVFSSYAQTTGAAANLTVGGNGNLTITNGISTGSGGTAGGALTYNGLGVLTIGASSYTGATTLTHGTIDLTGALTGPSSVAVNGGFFNEGSGGSITGAATLTLAGGQPTVAGGNVTLTGANTYTGNTTINPNSTLTLDYSAAGAAASGTILNGTSGGTAVVSNGGTLAIKGIAGGTSAQTIKSFTNSAATSDPIVLTSGAAGTLNLTITTLTHQVGGTMDITLPTSGTVILSGTNNTAGDNATNGLLSSANGSTGVVFATANGGTTWLANNTPTGSATAGGTLTPLSTYSTGSYSSSTANVNVTNGDSLSGAGSASTLRFNSATTALSLGTNTLTVSAGGILVTPGSNGTITGGALTSGKELVLIDYGTLGISSVISSTTNALTVGGTGTTTLSGSNGYTGTTTIENGATLVISNVSTSGSMNNALGASAVDIGAGGTLSFLNDGGAAANSGLSAGTINYGNAFLLNGITNINVNDLTNAKNGTVVLGNDTNLGTQEQLNVTGGNGYSLATGTITGPGYTSSGSMDFNPTSASLSIAALTASITGTANLFTLKFDGTASGNSIGAITNTGTTTGGVTYTAGIGLLKLNTSTWTLTGANTFTGGVTVDGGVLNVGNGSTGSLASNALTINGTSTTNFNEGAGINQSMGALAFTGGDGTVESTWGGSLTNTLTFASLSARSAGATENFVINGGTNGTSNSIVLTGATAGFISQGAFYDGGTSSANYAWMNGAGTYVRAINYSGDAGASTTAGAASVTGTYVQTTGTITAEATNTFITLDLAGTGTATGSNDFTLASSATLTVNGIMRSASTSTTVLATISGGAAITPNSTDLVIRTDGQYDSLTINMPIVGTSTNDNLVKSGAGTLTLGTAAVDTYFGNTYLNQGTLDISQDSNLGGVTTNAPTILFNGGTLQAGAAGISLVAARSINLGTVNGGQTFDTQGYTMTINGVISGGIVPTNNQATLSTSDLYKIGTGTLVLNGTDTYLSQTVISAGTLQLGNGGTSGAIGASDAIIDNGTFAVDRSNTVTQGYDFITPITGTGAVTQVGSGSTILNEANTYSGGTSVTSGVLYANSTGSGVSSTGSGAVSVTSGTLAGSGAIRPGSIASGYAVTVSGSGNITPGGIQSGTTATGSLTLDPTSIGSSHQLLSVAKSASLSVPALTFNLGASQSSSQIVVASGSGSNIINFNVGGNSSTSSVVSINDLNGGGLNLYTAYVLIQGTTGASGTTFEDNGTALTSLEGTSLTAYTGPITGTYSTDNLFDITSNAGLTLLTSTNGPTNVFAGYYGGSILLFDATNDSIDVEVVPEPSTWAMMFGGLAALIFWQRRKNKRS